MVLKEVGTWKRKVKPFFNFGMIRILTDTIPIHYCEVDSSRIIIYHLLLAVINVCFSGLNVTNAGITNSGSMAQTHTSLEFINIYIEIGHLYGCL